MSKRDEPKAGRNYMKGDKRKKMRMCLGFCHTEFLSTWPGHRICASCAATIARMNGIALIDMSVPTNKGKPND